MFNWGERAKRPKGFLATFFNAKVVLTRLTPSRLRQGRISKCSSTLACGLFFWR